MAPTIILGLWVWEIAFGFQYPWMLLDVKWPMGFVLFMREYYWLHEKNLKGAKDSGNDHVWAKIRRPIVKIQSVRE